MLVLRQPGPALPSGFSWPPLFARAFCSHSLQHTVLHRLVPKVRADFWVTEAFRVLLYTNYLLRKVTLNSIYLGSESSTHNQVTTIHNSSSQGFDTPF